MIATQLQARFVGKNEKVILKNFSKNHKINITEVNHKKEKKYRALKENH